MMGEKNIYFEKINKKNKINKQLIINELQTKCSNSIKNKWNIVEQIQRKAYLFRAF